MFCPLDHFCDCICVIALWCNLTLVVKVLHQAHGSFIKTLCVYVKRPGLSGGICFFFLYVGSQDQSCMDKPLYLYSASVGPLGLFLLTVILLFMSTQNFEAVLSLCQMLICQTENQNTSPVLVIYINLAIYMNLERILLTASSTSILSLHIQ